jgi:hypothetical protein
MKGIVEKKLGEEGVQFMPWQRSCPRSVKAWMTLKEISAAVFSWLSGGGWPAARDEVSGEGK